MRLYVSNNEENINVQYNIQLWKLYAQVLLFWVTLKCATTQNHPQPSRTTHNHPQSRTISYNHLESPKISHSHPKTTQKSQNLSQLVMLLQLDVNTETNVDFKSEMKQYMNHSWITPQSHTIHYLCSSSRNCSCWY